VWVLHTTATHRHGGRSDNSTRPMRLKLIERVDLTWGVMRTCSGKELSGTELVNNLQIVDHPHEPAEMS
ncbi:MAG TPA: hypothetical protein VFR73_07130, partial [Hyphomicrobiaceae bacterium]|nr:hypothetical protein [Hyphomicrobiaceae bacterium]